MNEFILFSSHLALSLPSVVTFSDGSTITYLYTADGRKLRTTHVINGTTTTTDYCGNVIYEGTTPKKLLTDEGYVDLTTATPTYYYYLKDHQGNNRVVINATGGNAVEVNHYYPFGSLFSTSTNVQPYKYNGKELDTKKGLNWYDYGARHYDAVLGRWHVVDPLVEKYYPTSIYAYCINNPVRYIDELGLDVKPYSQNELEMIHNTLSEEERNYVRLDKQGFIDKTLLNSYSSKSFNFNALKELVNSDILISVRLDNSYSYIDNEGVLHNKNMTYFEPDKYFMDVNFEYTNGLTTGETGNNGITLLPGKGESGVNSIDNGSIEIIVNDKLSKIGRAETYSHEANGHGLMFVRTRNREESAHKFNGLEEMNIPLKELIINSRKETIRNLK
ncbi:MAG: RHS repeat-associated core domain-containing protein [Mediterranea massiliensis]|nr:RHS repeat-associated core domain-containing protein [Mediterranea massiliensis]